MDVDRSEPCRLKQPSRQDLSIGRNDNEVRLQRIESLPVLFRPDLLRLVHRDSFPGRNDFDRTRMQFVTAARGTVRLGENGANLVSMVEKTLKGWNRKSGSAKKDDSHDYYQLPAFASFLILLRIRLRLKGLRRSMKSTPFR